jgi:hypothetical protein
MIGPVPSQFGSMYFAFLWSNLVFFPIGCVNEMSGCVQDMSVHDITSRIMTPPFELIVLCQIGSSRSINGNGYGLNQFTFTEWMLGLESFCALRDIYYWKNG